VLISTGFFIEINSPTIRKKNDVPLHTYYQTQNKRKNMNDAKFQVTTLEASRLLGISRYLVIKYVDSGFIKATITEGGHRKISLDEIKRAKKKFAELRSWGLTHLPEAK
jgi:excisionase family DNA binding protein